MCFFSCLELKLLIAKHISNFVYLLTNTRELVAYKIGSTTVGTLPVIPILSVEEQAAAVMEMSVHPNPATDYLSVNISQLPDAADELTITIVDLKGSLVASKNYTVADAYHLDIAAINPGLYTIQVTHNEQIIAIKSFIKQ